MHYCRNRKRPALGANIRSTVDLVEEFPTENPAQTIGMKTYIINKTPRICSKKCTDSWLVARENTDSVSEPSQPRAKDATPGNLRCHERLWSQKNETPAKPYPRNHDKHKSKTRAKYEHKQSKNSKKLLSTTNAHQIWKTRPGQDTSNWGNPTGAERRKMALET